MVNLVTDYGTFDLPAYWDGADGSGMAFRLPETIDGVEMVRFYAPAYALMLQAQDRAGSAGGMGFAMRFLWDTGTTAADPGAGEVRGNNTTANSITALYVNDADANGSDRTGVFALFDDGTSTVKGLVSLVKLTDPSAWMVGRLTATTDGAGFWTLTLTSVQASGATPFTAGDSIILGFVPTGDRGWPANGFRWTYSTTTTDGDPGAGVVRFNNATPASATQAFIDLVDAEGATQTTWLDGLDDATGTRKGQVRFAAQNDPTRYVSGLLTAVTSATGYRKLVFTVQSSAGALVNGEALFVSFQPAGDQGGLAGGTMTGSLDFDGFDATGIDELEAETATVTTATITTATATDATVTDTLTLSGGMQAQSLYLGDVSGDVVIESSTPLHVYLTLVGDTTLLVAGGTEPGGAHAHMVHPTMGGAGGYALDVEPANLLTYSEQFDNAAWTKTDTTISANAIAAPDGRTTADKVVEQATTASHYFVRSSTVSSGSNYTRSIFAKAGERGFLAVAATAGAASGTVTFDLSAGTSSVTFGSVVSHSITDDGDGWYRCAVTVLTTATTLTFQNRVVRTGVSFDSYLGDGTSGLYVWGAQLVTGSDPLGYAAVGATRAGMVGWQGYPIEWTSIAAGADVYSMVVSAEADGRIIQQDHTPEEL